MLGLAYFRHSTTFRNVPKVSELDETSIGLVVKRGHKYSGGKKPAGIIGHAEGKLFIYR